MEQPLISVIVPIYKVENYLDKCVESILAQTYTNIEVLLVNDGSPDGCGLKCDKWAKKDSRIKVIHKENGGVSDARNVALDVMNGDYVSFVDGDDTVTSDYIECMYNLVVKYDCDMAMCSFVFDYDGKERKYDNAPYKETIYTAQEAVCELFYQHKFDDYPWCKLYRKSLFEDIRFPKGVIFEDTCVAYLLMFKCRKLAYCNKQTLNYLIRKDSYEGAPFSNLKMKSALQVFQSLGNEHWDLIKLVEKAYKCRMLSFACHLLLKMPKHYNEKYVFWDKIKEYRMTVLFDIHARSQARIAAFISFFGLNAMQLAFKFVDKRM